MEALTGIRVLDLSIIVQGPQCGAMLHDLGAEVIKVELPAIGDLARHIPISAEDRRSAYYFACNRGKRSITLDLRTDAGREALLKLIEGADVLLSNFKPGTLDAWGLGYEDIAAVNPRLVWAAGSAFGPVGPDAEREGADLSGQASGGLISTTGVDGGDPTPVAAVIADHSGAQNLSIGILAALLARGRTGRGQKVEVSLLGSQIWAQASEYTHYLLSRSVPGRSNRGHPMLKAVYRIFPTADGWIAIVGIPPGGWPGFCRAVGRPDLADDPRYATLFVDPTDLANLVRSLEEDVFPTRTTDEWCARLRAEELRFAPVRDYAQVAADPQAWENGYFRQVDHPEWGPTSVVGTPIALSETPLQPGAEVAELGQHTEEVLLEAGFTWDDIDRLRAGGAW